MASNQPSNFTTAEDQEYFNSIAETLDLSGSLVKDIVSKAADNTESDVNQDRESLGNCNAETRSISFANDSELVTESAENTEADVNQDACQTVVISYTTTVNISGNANIIVGTPNPRMLVDTPNTRLLVDTPSTWVLASTPNTRVLASTPNTRVLVDTPNTQLLVGTPITRLLVGTPNPQVIVGTPNNQMRDGSPNTHMLVGTPNTRMIVGSAPNPTMLATPTRFGPIEHITVPNLRSASTSTPHESKMRQISRRSYNYVDKPSTRIHPPFLLGLDRSALFTASLHSEMINNTAPLIKGTDYTKSWFTKKQWLALISMILLYFAAYATMSILAPFFPEETKKKDLSSIMDGVIFSVYAFIIVIVSPLVGRVIPLTNPCAIYVFGIALVGFSNIAFGMITYIEEKWTFSIVSIILRIIGAVGAACYLTVVYAIVPEVFPRDINTVNGMLETAVGVGMCMGPALGVWLYTIGGFPLPFMVVGGFMLLCIPVCWMTFPTDLKKSSEDGIQVKGVGNIIFKPGVLLSVCILACTSFCQALLFPTLQPHMDKLGVSIEHVGLIFLLLSAMYSLASPLVGLATDRYKCPEAFMFAGLPIMTIALFFLGNSPILPFISTTKLIHQDLIAIVLLGLSLAMCVVPTFAAMLQYSREEGEPVDLATSAMCGGLWSSFYALGEMVGPLYAGFMCEYLSFAAVTTITCLLPLTLMLWLGIFMLIQCNKQCCRQPHIYEQFNKTEIINAVT